MKNAKKILSLTLALVMLTLTVLTLAACGEETPAPSEKKETEKKTVAYYVTVGGAKIALQADAAAAEEVLGTPDARSSLGDCGGLGETTKVTYHDVVIEERNGKVTGISVMSDAIVTPEGVSIGDAKADVIKKLGKDYSANAAGTQLTYKSGKNVLIVAFRDDSVSAIEYSYNG